MSHPVLRSTLTPLAIVGLLLLVFAQVRSVRAAPAETTGETRRAALLTETVTAVRRVLATGLSSFTSPGPDTAIAVELLDASLAGERLTLNFSRAFLRFEPGSALFEEVSRTLHRAIGEVLDPALAQYEVRTLIDGMPLDRLFAELDNPDVALGQSQAQAAPPNARLPSPQALAARRVAVSPGHGYYLNGTRWVLQRDSFTGIVEDFVNHDLVVLIDSALREAGAAVFPTRELNRLAGAGESGFPRWQEAARYHVKALGADPSVWNESGFTHLEQDIRCRPRYANAINADVLVSVHNNGGGGTGTETLYDTNNSAAAESKRLADIVHASIITAIRRDYNAAWVDRRVKGFNGSYGENRLAACPSVIIELAFMDRATPDNASLQDEAFKGLVARAIRDGLRQFFEGPLTLPEAPTELLATPQTDAIELTWTDRSNNESGFRVERRPTDGNAWATLSTLGPNVMAHRDVSALATTMYDYRVVSFNAAGDSILASNEATSAPKPLSTRLVIADEAPGTVPVRDWLQTASFTLTVRDETGAPIPGASLRVEDGLRNLTLPAAAAVTDQQGRFTYESGVPSGQADGLYRITFQASKRNYASSAARVRSVQVSHLPAPLDDAPLIVQQPAALDVTAPAEARFAVAASGAAPLTYQWFRDGIALPGAVGASLTIAASRPVDAGRYVVVVANAGGTATSIEAPLRVSPSAWLANVSVRTTLGASQTVIVGFVVGGGTRDLLLRAAGPSLAAFGLASAMADPRLVLYRETARITANNDWSPSLGAAMGAAGAFPFPVASRDAALLQEIGGAHTVHATGTGGGVILIEGYDSAGAGGARLINLSARNRVGTDADILIAGFVVAGTGIQRLLIRAVGPTLAALGVPGVLADPRLEVFDGTTRVAGNDNWESPLAGTFAQVGAFALPPSSLDSAVVVTLAAGKSYTAQVSGVNGGTGEALVEVYELPPL